MIVKYSEENGFGMIVDTSKPWPQSNVLWWDQAADITKAVVDAYNVQSGVPAPAAPGAGAAKPAAPKPPTGTRDQARDPKTDRTSEVVTDTSGVQKVPAGRVKTRPFSLRQHRLQQSAWCP